MGMSPEFRERHNTMLAMLTAGAASLGGNPFVMSPGKMRKQMEPKPCVYCKQLHTTGKAFCGAECCKAYKAHKAENKTPPPKPNPNKKKRKKRTKNQ